MGELAGKRAIITGGTRGIGQATVRQFALAGAQVHYTGSSPASVSRAREQLGDGVPATGHACDVRDMDGMRILLAGGCDILVNNAAIAEPDGPLHQVPDQGLRELLDITLIGALQWARHAAAIMAESGGGTIVNVSSGVARRAVPNMGAYCVAKAGLAMASRVLDAELAGRGVRVFSFEPGLVDTDMQTGLRESGMFDGVLPSDRSQLLPPDEPARVIRWLCSPGGDAFTGCDLSIYEEELREAIAAAPVGA